MTNTVEITTDNLDAAIEEYKRRGYRLDMIVPADAPREAVLSEPPAVAGGLSSAETMSGERKQIRLVTNNIHVQPPATAGGSDWVLGRAGMEYRDLIPGRLGGKVIASHIRLTTGGEVPDYVHYHKVDFQMIYCKRGRIRVVYEDQGPPFWLETGDCVLQPPEIRHRVLECTAGAEVLEISMPAEHETWVEHDITLPTHELKPDRDFRGQRFAHRKFSDILPIKAYQDDIRNFDLARESDDWVNVNHISFGIRVKVAETGGMAGLTQFCFVIQGRVTFRSGQKVLDNDSTEDTDYETDEGFIIPPFTLTKMICTPETELLMVTINTEPAVTS